jgi:hypothetical protein
MQFKQKSNFEAKGNTKPHISLDCPILHLVACPEILVEQ